MRLKRKVALLEEVSRLHDEELARMGRVLAESTCGEHEYQFDSRRRENMFGEQVFVFKCAKCGKVRLRRGRDLAPKECAALKTLGFPVIAEKSK